MNMSATTLPFVQTQLTRYGATALLILGNIGNVCIVLLFSQHRRNPCSMYLIAGAVMNSVSLAFNVSHQLFSIVHGDPTAHSLVYCRLRFYFANVFGQMARYLIVLACIDRYALTSQKIRIRALSRPSVALWSIGIITFIWHLFPIHHLFLMTIMNERCGAYNAYLIFYSVYHLIFLWLVPCAAMLLFGYMAYANLKQVHARVRPIRISLSDDSANIIISRRDRDLFVIVLTEVLAYVLLTLLFPGIFLETSATSYMATDKSQRRVQIENFVFFISQFLLTMTAAMPFYIYLAASQAFRNEFKKYMNGHWHQARRRAEIVHQMMTGHTL